MLYKGLLYKEQNAIKGLCEIENNSTWSMVVPHATHRAVFIISGRGPTDAGYHEASTSVSTELLCRKPAEPSLASQKHQSVPQPWGEHTVQLLQT